MEQKLEPSAKMFALQGIWEEILRWIFGTAYSNGHRGIRCNYELLNLCTDIDIVNLIRVRGLNWIGHINRVDDTRKVEQIFGSQPEGVRTRGR